MSSHDNHASCPQCRMAAGECHLDIENPCYICGGWTSKQWSKLRRSLVDARTRTSQRGRLDWTAAFPQLVAWILARPESASSSTPASEVASLVSEDDFEDNVLVSTPSQPIQQVLVVQTQNGVNKVSGTSTTAPSTAITAPSTAPVTSPLTSLKPGPSTIEPIVPIVAQVVALDMPSVNQGARPALSTEQTVQSTQRYGTLPYAAMPAMLARNGLLWSCNQFPLMPNPSWKSVREQMLGHQLLQERQQFKAWRASQAQPQPQPQPRISFSGLPIKVEDYVEIFSVKSASAKRPRPKDQAAVKALEGARSTSTSHRSLSPRRDYPRGTCTATRPSQASPKRAQVRPAPAQDIEAKLT